jgi:hypothetical protein
MKGAILAKTIASWLFLLDMLSVVTKRETAMTGPLCIANWISSLILLALPAAAAIRSPSPYPRTYSVNSLEGAVECRLISKSAPNGDIGKGQAGVHHKISGPVDTAFRQPIMRRLAKGPFEGPRKVAYGQFACFCNLLKGNVAIQISLQELACCSHLPGRESATKLRRRHCHAAISADQMTLQGL